MSETHNKVHLYEQLQSWELYWGSERRNRIIPKDGVFSHLSKVSTSPSSIPACMTDWFELCNWLLVASVMIFRFDLSYLCIVASYHVSHLLNWPKSNLKMHFCTLWVEGYPLILEMIKDHCICQNIKLESNLKSLCSRIIISNFILHYNMALISKRELQYQYWREMHFLTIKSAHTFSERNKEEIENQIRL